MAIIYSYPEIPEVEGGDLLLISDTGAPNKPTRSVDIDDLAAYIGTVVGVVQNLQSVLTVGNTYVSADGYGTFTLNDTANNDGSITFVNPDEGWGYQISAEEGFNITNGSGTNLMSIYSSGLSIRDGVQIMNIGTNTLTATRNVYFPDASGTIALENVSEWYSVTGSRDLGNLVVKIGDYDGSGNGTFLTVDDSDESMFFTKGNSVESKFVFAATNDRDYTFPDADGTIALTSDIPSPGPSGSGTTNYTARWTSASALGIGTLYDNGTNVGIGTTTPTQKLEVNGTVLFSTLPGNNGRLCLGSVSTNLFSNAASGHLYISTNGSTRMTVLNNGNVGIGTTSPANKLHVEGGNIQLSDNQHITWGYGGNNAIYGNNSSDFIKIFTNGAERLIVNSSGNVGIGTTNPSAILNIVNSNPKIVLEDSDNVGTFGQIRQQAGNLQFLSNNNTANGTIQFKLDDGTNITDAMYISSAGNVGIGTTSPSRPLSVYRSTAGSAANFLHYTDATAFAGLYIDVDNVNNIVELNASGDTASTMAFQTGNAERMRITTTGNVGIGTTSPSNVLTIETDSNAKGIDFDAGGTRLGSIERMTIGSAVSIGLEGANGRPVSINNNHDSQVLIANGGGNVGIGVTTPLRKLHVAGGSGFVVNASTTQYYGVYIPALGEGADPRIDIGDWHNAGSTIKWDSGARSLNLDTQYSTSAGTFNITGNDGASTFLTILPSGNVGIGTTNPTVGLQLGNSTLGQTKTAIFNSEGGSEVGLTIQSRTNRAKLRVADNDSNAYVVAEAGKAFFGASSNGDTNNITVLTSGNVGIGTDSPSHLLQLSGSGNVALAITSGTTNTAIINFGDSSNDDAGIIAYTNDAGGSDNMAFTVATNEKMRILANGNVGIGTTNPTRDLHLHRDTLPDIHITNNASGSGIGDGATLTLSSLDFLINNRESGNLRLFTSATERMRINSAGNVGIGTTSPAQKLHLNNSAELTPTYQKFTNGTATTGTTLGIDADGDFLINNGEAKEIKLYTNDSQRVTIQSGGNVGIGTTSPGAKLEIKKASSGVTAVNSQADALFLQNSSSTGITIATPDANKSGIFFSSASRQIGARINWGYNDLLMTLGTATSNASLALKSGNESEAVRIVSNGNVGIGTTSPNAKLNVNGNIKIEGTNALLLGGSSSVPSWEIKHDGSDLIINDTGTNVGSVLFNNDEGIVLPRLTTTEINAISLPSTGLTVYNTTLNTLCFYNGSTWQKVSHANM